RNPLPHPGRGSRHTPRGTAHHPHQSPRRSPRRPPTNPHLARIITRVFDCRLIIDPPASGAHNMAVDEALLIDAAEHHTATLRFYSWKEPTLSLGYFQHYA